MKAKTPQTVDSQHYTVKGTSWLLGSQPRDLTQPNSSRLIKGMVKVMQQNKKWKKNTANRFARYSKVMSRNIENKLKEEDKNYNSYQYGSLRQTESQAKLSTRNSRLSRSFYQQRSTIECTIFDLRKQEKGIELQAEKVGKLKQITNIFEQKKHFYDSCIEGYFKNYEKEINRTISRLTKGPYLHRQRPVINC